MAYVMIDHQIADPKEFARIFEDSFRIRGLLGCTASKAVIDAEDPHHVLAVFEWSDLAGALKFAKSMGTEQATEWASSGISYRIWVGEEPTDPGYLRAERGEA